VSWLAGFSRKLAGFSRKKVVLGGNGLVSRVGRQGEPFR
jgi:hypothetical protein